ncbi:MAG: hypothetical protein AB8I08_28175 [Sandaracinaceae bacterium]
MMGVGLVELVIITGICAFVGVGVGVVGFLLFRALNKKNEK